MPFLFLLLIVGCTNRIETDHKSLVSVLVGKAVINGGKVDPQPEPTPSKKHLRKDCPVDGWIKHGDGHETPCPDCIDSNGSYYWHPGNVEAEKPGYTAKMQAQYEQGIADAYNIPVGKVREQIRKNDAARNMPAPLVKPEPKVEPKIVDVTIVDGSIGGSRNHVSGKLKCIITENSADCPDGVCPIPPKKTTKTEPESTPIVLAPRAAEPARAKSAAVLQGEKYYALRAEKKAAMAAKAESQKKTDLDAFLEEKEPFGKVGPEETITEPPRPANPINKVKPVEDFCGDTYILINGRWVLEHKGFRGDSQDCSNGNCGSGGGGLFIR